MKQQEMQKQKKRGSRGAMFFLTGFLATFILAFIGFAAAGVWPFGDGTGLIIDSIHQYLPFYTEYHDKLRSGTSLLYSFRGALGYDFWATFAYYLASPLNLLLYFVPTHNVCDFMDLMFVVKIALCGGTMSWYLGRRKPQSRFLPAVFGVMFALSNFFIGYYFNLMWLDSIAMLPLIMYGIEQIVQGKSGRVYGFSLAYAVWCNYYIGFMLCFFSVLYFLITLPVRRGLGLRGVIRRGLVFAWYSLLGGGAAAAVLLPAYASLSASEAMQSNTWPSVIKFYTNLTDMIEAQFVSVLPINISDTQVGLNAYCGVAVLMLVLLYILDEEIDWVEKLGKLGLAAMVMLSFSLNILNYIWHGLHVQNGLPNRFAFIFIALLLVISFDTLQHIKTIEPWKVVLCGLMPTALSIYMCYSGEVETKDAGMLIWLTPVLLVIYTLMILIGRLSNMKSAAALLMVGVLLLCESGTHGIVSLIHRGSVTRSIYLNDQTSYKTLLSGIDEGEFYRSEIDNQRMRNVTLFAGGNSTVMFNSTMLYSVTHFFDKIGMEARTNKNGYNGLTRLMNDVLGVRYVLSSNGKREAENLYGFEKLNGDGNLTLYKNEDALSIGFMAEPEIRYWDTENGTPAEIQNKFAQLAANVEDVYILDRTINAEDGETYDIKIPEGKQVYLYLPSRIASIKIDSPEYTKTYTTYTDHMYVLNGSGEENIAHVTTKLRDGQAAQPIYVYLCTDEAVHNVVSTLAQSQLADVSAVGNVLSGHVDAAKDGILVITVPYEKNWTWEVDGEKVEALKIGGTLTGLELSQGSHSIRMKYVPGGFNLGVVLSLISILLLIISAFVSRRREKEELMYGKEISVSKLAQSFKPGIFALLAEKKKTLVEEGRNVYDLSVGTPDFQPSQEVMEAVSKAALDPDNYKYSITDRPELIQAVQAYYKRRFGVELAQDEITSVYGSQEGMGHIAWAIADPGDLFLVPDPCYPVFMIGPEFCGAKPYFYPLTAENDFLPDLDAIPVEIAERARFMLVSYPGNPIGKVAPDEFYEKLIAFAKRYGIIVIHDSAYADIVFGGRKGRSFLSYEGAKEIGVEFYSLSKTFDYTGARLSFVTGNAKVVQALRTIRSQIDYGIFLPVQMGGIAALSLDGQAAERQALAYERRMETFCEGLRSIGWPVENTEGGMFVWAKIPKGLGDSEAFVQKLMEASGVICTPGSAFGPRGEGYVRFALVLPEEKLSEAVAAIDASGILN